MISYIIMTLFLHQRIDTTLKDQREHCKSCQTMYTVMNAFHFVFHQCMYDIVCMYDCMYMSRLLQNLVQRTLILTIVQVAACSQGRKGLVHFASLTSSSRPTGTLGHENHIMQALLTHIQCQPHATYRIQAMNQHSVSLVNRTSL